MSDIMRPVILTLFAAAVCMSGCGGGKNDKYIGTTWKGVDSPLFGTVFTQLTPENAGKWSEAQPYQNNFSWHVLDQMMDVAEKKDLIVKQHALIWYQQAPRWITGENAEQSVIAWFEALKARYGDKFNLIDVVNEPLDGVPEYFAGIPCGEGQWDWVVWSFKLARRYFPKSKLLINEYGILNSAEKAARYAELIALLAEMKLVDGIGLQGHGLEKTSADLVKANLETIKALKLPIYISEWDLNHSDDEAQLRQMREQFPIFWDEPMVKGITFWGHLVGKTWRADAYLVYADGRYRPAFQWMLEYIEKKN